MACTAVPLPCSPGESGGHDYDAMHLSLTPAADPDSPLRDGDPLPVYELQLQHLKYLAKLKHSDRIHEGIFRYSLNKFISTHDKKCILFSLKYTEYNMTCVPVYKLDCRI